MRRFQIIAAVSTLACVAAGAGIYVAAFRSAPAEAGFVFQIQVNTTADEDSINGLCSLREAIITANMNANYKGCSVGALGDDTHIVFDIGSGTPTINISSPLPPITDDVNINGNTGGATRVQLLGDGGFGDIGLRIQADDSFIGNMVISGFGSNGILVDSTANNTIIRGNFIGTDPTGTAAVGNGNGIGISGTNTVIGGTSGWTPGGSCTGDCNLLSGNQYGVVIGAIGTSGTQIIGNMVGTNAAGTAALGNESAGLNLQGPFTLGDDVTGSGNLIAGNESCGVYAAGATGTIQGNFVGTDTTGMASLPNEIPDRAPISCGVWLAGDAHNTVVGGTSAGARNVLTDAGSLMISDSDNVSVLGNYIGVGADGVTPVGPETDFSGVQIGPSIGTTIGGIQPGEANIITNHENGVIVFSINGDAYKNLIRGNSIYGNDSAGIVLSDDDIPPLNQQANLGIEPPVITGQGSVHGTACATCLIDIFSDSEDEGRIYEGSTTADGFGNWSFNDTPSGPFITATATDPDKGTSEFSEPFALVTPTPSPTPSPSPTANPNLVQGDTNCDGEIDFDDVEELMLFAVGLSSGLHSAPCPDLGEPESNSGFEWGDLNCDGEVNMVDAYYALAHLAGIALPQSAGNCFDIGSGIT